MMFKLMKFVKFLLLIIVILRRKNNYCLKLILYSLFLLNNLNILFICLKKLKVVEFMY